MTCLDVPLTGKESSEASAEFSEEEGAFALMGLRWSALFDNRYNLMYRTCPEFSSRKYLPTGVLAIFRLVLCTQPILTIVVLVPRSCGLEDIRKGGGGE